MTKEYKTHLYDYVEDKEFIIPIHELDNTNLPPFISLINRDGMIDYITFSPTLVKIVYISSKVNLELIVNNDIKIVHWGSVITEILSINILIYPHDVLSIKYQKERGDVFMKGFYRPISIVREKP